MVQPARGACPVCGRDIALLTDGRVGRHGSKEPAVWPPRSCNGWGQLPKEPQSPATDPDPSGN